MTLKGKKILVLLAGGLLIPLLLSGLQWFLGSVDSEDGYRLRAQKAMDEKNWPGLLAVAKEWRRIYPGSPVALAALADGSVGVGDMNTALAAFQESLRMASAQPTLWVRFGAALFNNGRYAEAVNACRQGLELDPTQIKGWMCVGLGAAFHGDWAVLQQADKELIQRSPDTEKELRTVVAQHACTIQRQQLGREWCPQ